ncbi:hypothetical protein H2198_006338 [Neophaeococcomyces mojaviensis]|uniref:Uncharacterized protein n=1 Tax=Neophaeococcomyces mojaviensis TaxID=3383035 RepID=A0ACC3A365_9EURO|nr:hypothetical protein H2198_006338 [Knufia sp. JES_112]
MDRRSSRSEAYDSYRPPSYNSHRDQQNPRDVIHAKSRPHHPPRSESRSGVPLHDPRSATTTPAESPKSPQGGHGQSAAAKVGITPQANQSLDPRKRLANPIATVNEQAILGDSNDASLISWLEHSVQQAVLKNSLDRLQSAAKDARKQEEEQKQRFPDHIALHEQYATRRVKSQQNVDAFTTRFNESLSTERSQRGSALKAIRAMLNSTLSETGLNSEHFEAQQQEISNVVRRLNDFENSNKRLEEEVKRLTNENDSLRTQCISKDDHDKCYQKLKSMYDNRISKATGDLQQKVASCEQTIKECKAWMQERDSPKSPPGSEPTTHDNEELLALKTVIDDHDTKLEDHKLKFARMSNLFTSLADHKDLAKKFESLENALASNKLEMSGVAKRLDQVTLPQGLQVPNAGSQTTNVTAPQDTRSIQEQIDGLTISVSQQNAALKNELEQHLKGYRQFTVDTLGKLSTANEKLNANDSRVEDLETILTTLDNRETNRIQSVLQKVPAIESAITDLRSKISALESDGTSLHTLNEAMERLQKAETQLRIEVSTLMESKSTQIKAEVSSIHEIVKRNDHSIESLNTRYNAITTQMLYKSIVATLEPMAPRIGELEADIDQVQSDIRTLKESCSSLAVSTELKDQFQKLASIDHLGSGLDKMSVDTRQNTERVQQLSEQIKVLDTQFAENTKALMKLEELYNTLQPITNGDTGSRISTPSSTSEAHRPLKQDVRGSQSGLASMQEASTSLKQIHARIASLAHFMAVTVFDNDFLLIERVASNVDEKKLRSSMQGLDLGEIFFRGSKHETTGRYALVKMLSPDRIPEAIEKFNNQRWNGRSVKVSRASARNLENVILSQPVPVPALAPAVGQPADNSVEPEHGNGGDEVAVNSLLIQNKRRGHSNTTRGGLVRSGSSSGTPSRRAAKRHADEEGGGSGQTTHIQKRGRT